jgi:hypothetical protein
MKMKWTVSVFALLALLSIGSASAKVNLQLASIERGGVGTVECLRVQRAAQAAVQALPAGANQGQRVSTAAHVAAAALGAHEIDGECASCIITQFAHLVPIDEQTPCGEEPEMVAPLRGPEIDACDGAAVGTTTIRSLLSGDAEVEIELAGAPANATFNVFWVCTDVPNGCHLDGCSFVLLAPLTTDGSGNASYAATVAGGNPFPGKYVHIDVCPPVCGTPRYTSVFGGIPATPLRAVAKGRPAGGMGDPTAQPEPLRPWTSVKQLYR